MKKKLYSITLSLCLVSSIALAPLNTTSTTTALAKQNVFIMFRVPVTHIIQPVTVVH